MARIGIDLGTTNTVVAFTSDGFNPKVITTRDHERLTPSVVTQSSKSLLVGLLALQQSEGNPENTIYSIKRLMGRRYTDPEVEKIKQHLSYRIVPYSDSVDLACVMIGDKIYTPMEISALILQSIKAEAEFRLGEKVTHAVITVPAYFDDNQKEATRQAGGMAGLKVSRIIDEPSAAAYAYGLTLEHSKTQALVVYDLGGGTFDVSVIFISEGIPTVENIKGDNWLGGDKFDHMIMDYVLSQSPAGEKLRQDKVFRWKLKLHAEKAKRTLGHANSTDIVDFNAGIEVTLHRTDFEAWILPEIRRSLDLVHQALDGAGMTPEDIDRVLLVGGSTSMPMVQQQLSDAFGKDKVTASVDPMECVALGAAMLAARIEKKYCIHDHENELEAEVCAWECDGGKCNLDLRDAEPRVKCPHCAFLNQKHDVRCRACDKPLVGGERIPTAKPYGIGVEGNRLAIVVPKGTLYPTTGPLFKEFKTVSDYQEWIIFPVYQGFEEEASRNEKQCDIKIGPIPKEQRAPRDTPVDVGFGIDQDGILTVVVQGKGPLAGLTYSRVVRAWENGHHPEVGDAGGTVDKTAPCPRCGEENPRGAGVCSRCGETLKAAPTTRAEWERDLHLQMSLARVAVQEYDWAIKSENLATLRSLLERAERAIETKDEANGRTMLQELKQAMDSICGGIDDLLYASLTHRYRMGELDQNQQLGSMLAEYKRRVLEGENPHSGELGKLRGERIPQLLKEIWEGLGDQDKVTCEGCQQKRIRPTPMLPACEHCGHIPLGLK